MNPDHVKYRLQRRRPNWPLRWVLIALLAPAILHAFCIPAWEFFSSPIPEFEHEQTLQQTQFSEGLLQHGMESLMALWILFFGGAIGSFLNVVVYRMPRGMSLVKGGSACPFCRTKIRSTDNVPVLGWLRLRGRCRACRLPISTRYPTVEAFTAILFLVLFWVELSSGGMNLPGFQPSNGYGVAGYVLDSRWDLFAIYGFHAALFSGLISIALIAYDGFQTPLKLTMILFAMAIGWSVGWPWISSYVMASESLHAETVTLMYPVAAFPIGSQQQAAAWWIALQTGLIGAGAGLIVGLGILMLGKVIESSKGFTSPRFFLGVVSGPLVTGAFLGWQSLLPILGLGSILGLLLPTLSKLRRPRKRLPFVGAFGVSAYVFVLSWSLLF